jgi:hypothetical protein
MTPESHDHGPITSRRIPAAEYEQYGPAFLEDLKNQGKVAEVAENWTIDQLRNLPPSVKYLLYPNGDLQHL